MIGTILALKAIVLGYWNTFWPHQITSPEVDAAILSFFGSLLVSSATVALTVYVTYKINKQTQDFTERIQKTTLEEQKRQSFYDHYYSRQMELIRILTHEIDEILEHDEFYRMEKILRVVDHDGVFFNETIFYRYLFGLCRAYQEIRQIEPQLTNLDGYVYKEKIVSYNHELWSRLRELVYDTRQAIKQGIQDQMHTYGEEEIELRPIERHIGGVLETVTKIESLLSIGKTTMEDQNL